VLRVGEEEGQGGVQVHRISLFKVFWRFIHGEEWENAVQRVPEMVGALIYERTEEKGVVQIKIRLHL